MTEYPQHLAAKTRIFNLLNQYNPKSIGYEYVFHNPNNQTCDIRWEWKFDLYVEFKLDEGTEIIAPNMIRLAIEIDGWKGHWSRKQHTQTKQNIAKRNFKIEYLKSQGISLFAWPVKWLVGRDALPDSVFIDELHLTSMPIAKEWYNE